MTCYSQGYIRSFFFFLRHQINYFYFITVKLRLNELKCNLSKKQKYNIIQWPQKSHSPTYKKTHLTPKQLAK